MNRYVSVAINTKILAKAPLKQVNKKLLDMNAELTAQTPISIFIEIA